MKTNRTLIQIGKISIEPPEENILTLIAILSRSTVYTALYEGSKKLEFSEEDIALLVKHNKVFPTSIDPVCPADSSEIIQS
jgi:hypothetical protein